MRVNEIDNNSFSKDLINYKNNIFLWIKDIIYLSIVLFPLTKYHIEKTINISKRLDIIPQPILLICPSRLKTNLKHFITKKFEFLRVE